MSDKELFSQNLRQALERQGLSASELARRLEMHPSAVYNWLKGKSAPGSARKWNELAQALGVDVRPTSILRPEAEAGPLPMQTFALIKNLLARQQRLGAELQEMGAELQDLLKSVKP